MTLRGRIWMGRAGAPGKRLGEKRLDVQDLGDALTIAEREGASQPLAQFDVELRCLSLDQLLVDRDKRVDCIHHDRDGNTGQDDRARSGALLTSRGRARRADLQSEERRRADLQRR